LKVVVKWLGPENLTPDDERITRVAVLDDSGSELGCLLIYEYRDGSIEVSRYFEVGRDYKAGERPDILDVEDDIGNP